MFIGLLTSPANGSNQRKCVSLSNQKSEIHPTLNNLRLKTKATEFNFLLLRELFQVSKSAK